MKQLAVGIFLTGGVGPFARRKCGIEQYVRFQIVDKQVGVAVEPFGILLPEFGEDCLPFTFDQRRSLVDQRFDLFSLLSGRSYMR